jgi:NADH-quinone oxidoreductase subunit B
MVSNTMSGSPEFIPTSLTRLAAWARQQSLTPMSLGTACCAAEIMAAQGARFDLARLGVEALHTVPQQADVLLVSGRISLKMAPVIKRVYERIPAPKWVVALGACACSGGIFDTYSVVQGVDRFIPVDVYVPGCPPRPEDIIDAIQLLQNEIVSSNKEN